MTDAPYYLPPEEGPIFPDESGDLAGEVDTFLRVLDRDVTDAVSRENTRDRAEASFEVWLRAKIAGGEISLGDDVDPDNIDYRGIYRGMFPRGD